MNLRTIMNKLREERKVFHSEADFQHSLGWMIREHHPNARVRLEVKNFYPTEASKGPKRKRTLRKSVDILVEVGRKKLAIELKYKTKKVKGFTTFTWDGEKFQVPTEGARDISRYDFLSDVIRLEKNVISGKVAGYAILLTNDPLYWEKPTIVTIDREFRIHKEKGMIKGRMKWQGAGKGTTKNREAPIVIKKEEGYPIVWKHYSDVEDSEFRYLLVQIG